MRPIHWNFIAGTIDAGNVLSLRALCWRFLTRSRQSGLVASDTFCFQQGFDIRVLINDAGTVLKEPAGICSRTVRAVQLVAKHPQISRQLPAMVCRMSDSPHEYPCAAPNHVEESCILLKP